MDMSVFTCGVDVVATVHEAALDLSAGVPVLFMGNAWFDSGYMYCDSSGVLLEVFPSFSACLMELGY